MYDFEKKKRTISLSPLRLKKKLSLFIAFKTEKKPQLFFNKCSLVCSNMTEHRHKPSTGWSL